MTKQPNVEDNKNLGTVEQNTNINNDNDTKDCVTDNCHTDKVVVLQTNTDDNGNDGKTKNHAKAVDEQTLDSFDAQDIAPPKKKKYGWIGTVLLLVVIGVGLYLMIAQAAKIGEGEMQSFGDIIANLNWTYLYITLGILVTALIADCLKYSVVTKTIKGKSNFATSSKVAFLGKYYDNITPFASGGQPMQIYYLHKKGYSGGEATAVILIKYFANMFAWVTICFLLMIFNRNALDIYVQDVTTRNVFLIAGWIGWAVNAMMPALIILFVILPKLTTKMVGGIISLGHKMRLVKDKDKVMNKALKGVHEFRSGFRIMSQHPLKFIWLVLLCIVEPFITMSLPYFVLVMLGGDSIEISLQAMFAVMALNVYATMSVSVIPTPGNSGFAENAVLLVFSNIAKTVVFWVVFVWRFLTYYIYILIGIIITLFEIIRNAIRKRRNKNDVINISK